MVSFNECKIYLLILHQMWEHLRKEKDGGEYAKLECANDCKACPYKIACDSCENLIKIFENALSDMYLD